MEARDLAERLKDMIKRADEITPGRDDVDAGDLRWGYGDADFFVDVEDEGTFIVSVVKVAEAE